MSLVGRFIDDSFALDGTPVLEGAAAFMGELLLRPAKENGVFRADYVKSEGVNLADLIRSEVNDKRAWSLHRLTEVMCEGRPTPWTSSAPRRRRSRWTRRPCGTATRPCSARPA